MHNLKMSCGIYIIICTGNGKVYTGQSINIEKRKCNHFNMLRNNAHRNPHMQSAFNLYGEESFEHMIMETVPVELLNARELYWINRLNSRDQSVGFNLCGGGDSIHTLSEETRAKISKAGLGREFSDETREKLSKAGLGKKLSDETRAKLSKASLGKKMSPESVAKSAKANLGRKASDETRAKMTKAQLGKKKSPEAVAKSAKARLGQKRTPETIAKMKANMTPAVKAALRAARLGKKLSPETLAKLSKANLGKKASPEARANMRAAQARRKANQQL